MLSCGDSEAEAAAAEEQFTVIRITGTTPVRPLMKGLMKTEHV